MNYNQNRKIAQITPETLIIGVDIAKFKHVARAQNFRGIEFGSPCYFENTKEKFQYFLDWIYQLKQKHEMHQVIVGMEPTGHYWFNLAHILKEKGIKFLAVNPLYVKKTKELDDNSPTKNHMKDAREPRSDMAKLELATLIEKYEFLQSKLEELDARMDGLIDQIPGVPQMIAIKVIGRDTVAGFFAEVGDLNEYSHPRQIMKLAGLSLKENTSGKHKGQTRITKRGRKKLRALLFRVCMILVAKNSAFKALHTYYTQ